MSKAVEIKFVDGKFVAFVGKTRIKSASRKYVEKKIAEMGGTTAKAIVTASGVASTPMVADIEKFSITERFFFTEKLVAMVAAGVQNSAIILGEGGLGKSHTVKKTLEAVGFVDISTIDASSQGMDSFKIVKGFSTAKGLYRTLFENNGSIIVFDDCDSVLKDPVALNLLKGALDSYDVRMISWNADLRDDDLPRSFNFDGRVIFISNLPKEKVDQALRTRAMCVDLSMNESQKIERMDTIIRADDFLPNMCYEYKAEALAFLKEHLGECENLSLRTLISVCRIRATGTGWKPFARYIISQ